jgi:hypothetical protein
VNPEIPVEPNYLKTDIRTKDGLLGQGFRVRSQLHSLPQALWVRGSLTEVRLRDYPVDDTCNVTGAPYNLPQP